MHRQKITVAAHDHVRFPGSGEREVFVIFRIATLAHDLSGFHLDRRHHSEVEHPLATLDGSVAIEFRAKDDLSVFVLNFLREQKLVRVTDGAQERSLGIAVCFEGSRYESRSVDNNDQILRSERQASSSASMS